MNDRTALCLSLMRLHAWVCAGGACPCQASRMNRPRCLTHWVAAQVPGRQGGVAVPGAGGRVPLRLDRQRHLPPAFVLRLRPRGGLALCSAACGELVCQLESGMQLHAVSGWLFPARVEVLQLMRRYLLKYTRALLVCIVSLVHGHAQQPGAVITWLVIATGRPSRQSWLPLNKQNPTNPRTMCEAGNQHSKATMEQGSLPGSSGMQLEQFEARNK